MNGMFADPGQIPDAPVDCELFHEISNSSLWCAFAKANNDCQEQLKLTFNFDLSMGRFLFMTRVLHGGKMKF